MIAHFAEYEQLGNDLFVDFRCLGCAEKLKKFKRLKFTGYNDNYFFNVVNKDFRSYSCEDCETEYLYKWTVDGVILKGKVDSV